MNRQENLILNQKYNSIQYTSSINGDRRRCGKGKNSKLLTHLSSREQKERIWRKTNQRLNESTSREDLELDFDLAGFIDSLRNCENSFFDPSVSSLVGSDWRGSMTDDDVEEFTCLKQLGSGKSGQAFLVADSEARLFAMKSVWFLVVVAPSSFSFFSVHFNVRFLFRQLMKKKLKKL